jgi:hypothetical protein
MSLLPQAILHSDSEQVRLVRLVRLIHLQMDNFCLFLRHQTNK